MSDTRHPDLEIYIKNRTEDEILTWLENCTDQLAIVKNFDNCRELEAYFGKAKINCALQLKVSGKMWSSLWFKVNETPWNTDLECAIQAASEMNTQIRCIKAGWSDTDEDAENDEDQWWRIEDGEKTLISWKG
jgi:hypothetical protein